MVTASLAAEKNEELACLAGIFTMAYLTVEVEGGRPFCTKVVRVFQLRWVSVCVQLPAFIYFNESSAVLYTYRGACGFVEFSLCPWPS